MEVRVYACRLKSGVSPGLSKSSDNYDLALGYDNINQSNDTVLRPRRPLCCSLNTSCEVVLGLLCLHSASCHQRLWLWDTCRTNSFISFRDPHPILSLFTPLTSVYLLYLPHYPFMTLSSVFPQHDLHFNRREGSLFFHAVSPATRSALAHNWCSTRIYWVNELWMNKWMNGNKMNEYELTEGESISPLVKKMMKQYFIHLVAEDIFN